MSTTHVGKIGRLPKCSRDQLGQRIEDGEPGQEIVKWLNGLPGVQRVVAEQFAGRPITEQNLSEWKQNGHPDWLLHEETRWSAIRLTEASDDLNEAANGHELSDRFASVLAAEMARLATTLLEKESDPEKRWQRLCAVHQELSQLRRDDHRAVRTTIKREQWKHELKQEEDEDHVRAQKAHKDRLIDAVFASMQKQTISDAFGGGEYGKKQAELLHRIKFDLPLDDLPVKPAPENPDPAPVRQNPTQSNLIQPNPTKSNLIQPKMKPHSIRRLLRGESERGSPRKMTVYASHGEAGGAV